MPGLGSGGSRGNRIGATEQGRANGFEWYSDAYKPFTWPLSSVRTQYWV